MKEQRKRIPDPDPGRVRSEAPFRGGEWAVRIATAVPVPGQNMAVMNQTCADTVILMAGTKVSWATVFTVRPFPYYTFSGSNSQNGTKVSCF